MCCFNTNNKERNSVSEREQEGVEISSALCPAVLSKHNINCTGNNLFTFVLIVRKCPKINSQTDVFFCPKLPSLLYLPLNVCVPSCKLLASLCPSTGLHSILCTLSFCLCSQKLNQMSTDSKRKMFLFFSALGQLWLRVLLQVR